MAKPTGSMRELPYPLELTLDIESAVDSDQLAHSDLSSWSESDPDIKISIILNLSLNEYIALASCVDVGRDIAYGDNSIELWYIWCRSYNGNA